jgi:hypothetical protein
MSIWGQNADPEVLARARAQHPERFAPDGTALIEYPGSDWFERLNAWRHANGQPEVERPHEKHPLPTPVAPRNTYSDERAPTAKKEVPF